LFFIRRTEVNPEEEEPTGWVPLSIKISFDSGEIHVTKIDEVRTQATCVIVKWLIYVYFISPMFANILTRPFLQLVLNVATLIRYFRNNANMTDE